MASRKMLQRLLRLRELEEEQSRVALQAAAGGRDRIALELAIARQRQVRERENFVERIGDSDTAARTGAGMAMEQARGQQMRVMPRLKELEAEVTRRRGDFLTRRKERRQVEVLVEQDQENARTEVARRAQQMLDDWYGRRLLRQAAQPEKGRGMESDHRDTAESKAVLRTSKF